MAKEKSALRRNKLDLDHSPSHLLHRALQVALDIYAEELGPTGVTQRQYAVLSAVSVQDDFTQTDLVRITGIDRSTLADLVARMIGKGLLDRKRSPKDARANVLRLTEPGRSALEAARPKVSVVDERLLKRLPSGKRKALMNLLARLLETETSAEGGSEKKVSKEKLARKAEKRARKMAALVADTPD